jgi:hypothetical protein
MWQPMEPAPTDGTPILGLFDGQEVEMRWSEDRVCILAGTAAGAGTFGPGWEDTTNGLYVDEPECWRPVPTHAPCCAIHGASLDCDTYRRTHVVDPGQPCCDTGARRYPAGSWAPRGCPAGFSSECSSWTSTGPCRCLVATLSTTTYKPTTAVPTGEE